MRPKLPPELEADDLPGAFFGYNRFTTVKRLERLRDCFQLLVEACAEREARITELELELHRGRDHESLVGEALIAAQREARMLRTEARREGEELLKAARKQSGRILEEAEREAAGRAREIVDSAERERADLLEHASHARAFVEQTHEQLSDFLLAAVTWYEQAKPFVGVESPPADQPVSDAPEPEPSAPSNEASPIPSA